MFASCIKNCLFSTPKLTRMGIRSKFIYNEWGIPFDRTGSWSFGTEFDQNLVVFGVDNSSSVHNWLMILIIAFVQQEINSIKFTKANTKFPLSLHYNSDESYFCENKTEICKVTLIFLIFMTI